MRSTFARAMPSSCDVRAAGAGLAAAPVPRGRRRTGRGRSVSALDRRTGWRRDRPIAANERRPAGRDRAGLPEAAVPPRLVEGAAIVAGGANQVLASEFLRFLAETYPDRPAAETISAGSQGDIQLEELVADLVGATLVDAQDESGPRAGGAGARGRSRAGAPVDDRAATLASGVDCQVAGAGRLGWGRPDGDPCARDCARRGRPA